MIETKQSWKVVRTNLFEKKKEKKKWWEPQYLANPPSLIPSGVTQTLNHILYFLILFFLRPEYFIHN